jgi:hypothetical protein
MQIDYLPRTMSAKAAFINNQKFHSIRPVSVISRTKLLLKNLRFLIDLYIISFFEYFINHKFSIKVFRI